MGAGVSESGAGASIALHMPVLISFTGGYFFSASSFTSTPQPGPVGMWKTEFSTLGTTVTISSFNGLSSRFSSWLLGLRVLGATQVSSQSVQ